jgi:N-acetylglutamate synthase-like GNAT family acetyltransferase
MDRIQYRFFPHISELDTQPQGNRGDARLLQSTLELYDSALNGRSYNSEHNPYGMPDGRRQELIEDHIEESRLIIATPESAQSKAVGVASFYPEHTEHGDVLWVEGLAVDERYRHQAIGRNLIDHAVNHARSVDLGSLALRSIPGAISFYTHLGFTKLNDDHQPVFMKRLQS